MKATIKPDFLVRNIAGENVLIGGGTQINFSKMLMLNETAVLVVNELQEKGCATPEELAQIVAERYEVPLPQAVADTSELLQQLEALGVVCLEDE